MIQLEVDAQVLENQRLALQALSTQDPEMSKRMREAIFQELKAARNSIVEKIKFDNGDPRNTAHAVRRYIAKKYLGGVVSIVPTRHAPGPKNSYEPPRKVYPGMKGHRGGNRMIRQKRTDDILHYGPMDRDFILYYVDKGTNPRYANGRNGKWGKTGNRTFGRLQEQGDYFRGSIAPRNFFSRIGQQQLDAAAKNLGAMIDEEFNKMFKS